MTSTLGRSDRHTTPEGTPVEPEQLRILLGTAAKVPAVTLALIATLVVTTMVAASSDLTGIYAAIAGSWLALHQVTLTIDGVPLGGAAVAADSGAGVADRSGRTVGHRWCRRPRWPSARSPERLAHRGGHPRRSDGDHGGGTDRDPGCGKCPACRHPQSRVRAGVGDRAVPGRGRARHRFPDVAAAGVPLRGAELAGRRRASRGPDGAGDVRRGRGGDRARAAVVVDRGR